MWLKRVAVFHPVIALTVTFAVVLAGIAAYVTLGLGPLASILLMFTILSENWLQPLLILRRGPVQQVVEGRWAGGPGQPGEVAKAR